MKRISQFIFTLSVAGLMSFWLALVADALPSAWVAGAIIRVPLDYPTIQQAIDVAHDYHPTTASTAWEAGDPADAPPAADHEAEGVHRPQGLRANIEAYDWGEEWLYLPLVFNKWQPVVG